MSISKLFSLCTLYCTRIIFFQVSENLPINSIIGQYTATDADDPSEALTYMFLDDHQGLFNLDGLATLTLADELDYESGEKLIQLYIVATDTGPNSLTSTLTLQVILQKFSACIASMKLVTI